jgi:hypothetical protein
MREIDRAKVGGHWFGPPTKDECVAWAETTRQKGIDDISRALEESQ